MKKLILMFSLFASAAMFAAMSNTDKLTGDQINSNMETFREYKWGDSERDYNAYIYSVYYTGTKDRAEAAKIEAKAVQELKEGKGNLRYKMLLAQTLEIVGVANSAEAVGEIILKNSNDSANTGWVERLFNGIVTGGDKNTKKVLLGLTNSKTDYVRICAVTSLGRLGICDAEIATILANQAKGGFKDKSLSNACVLALARIGGENVTKFIFDIYKKASTPELKQSCVSAFFAAASRTKGDFSAAYSEIYADKNAPLGARIGAFTALMRSGKAPNPTQVDFVISAIDIAKCDSSIKIPEFLALSKLEEPLQALMVHVLAARGEGYAEIIALNPKSAELAEAICVASSKMGTEKDYAKLASFAPLFENRDLSRIGYYIAAVKAKNRILKLSEIAKNGSPEVQALVAASIEHMDSSAEADSLIAMAKSGDKNAQIFALKSLGTALSKNEEVFVKVAQMYPSFTDAQVVSAAQRLLVNNSRVFTTQPMFAAASEQFKLAKEPKVKTFFMRFTSPYGGTDAAEFLASAYSGGMKNEALAEFAKWPNEKAFDVLKKLENFDKTNKQAIRDTMVTIVQKNNLRESPIIKYISDTATNQKEKNLLNMLELPNFSIIEEKDLGNGFKGKATHKNNDLSRAFDGNVGTRWDTGTSRTKGMGIIFSMPSEEMIKGVELDLGSSGGDSVKEPIVFAGESMDNLSKVKIKYEKIGNKDTLTFEKPMKVKVVCVVNSKDQGGFWSIHEVRILK